jgi:predicted phage terminase large subunit-like protein
MATDAGSILLLAAQDLACYAFALRRDFELAAHHRLIIETLEAVERGEIKRLVVVLPPRSGKTLLVSQLFPAWFLGRNPQKSVISCTYGQDVSDDSGRKVRNFALSDISRAIFPALELRAASTSMRRFDSTVGGSYYAVGRGGPVTGRGCDLLICDDLLKDAEEARSELIRKNLHEWYKHVARTRLTSRGAIVLVGTRWHDDDLIGHNLREHPEENWRVLHLPAIAETNDALGRQEGEPLWPERFPLVNLEQIRQAIGPRAWASLYQGRPTDAEGAIFKRDWFRTCREMPSSFEKIVQSWDCAVKTGAANDYSVGTTWGVTANGYYLLALYRARLEFPELKRQIVRQADEWKPHAILIEDASAGASAIQELKVSTRFPVLAIKAEGSKISRAEAVTPMFESGRVFLPDGVAWFGDFTEELCAFPAGAHDDIVDSATMALNYLRGNPLGGLIELYREQAKAIRNGEFESGVPKADEPLSAAEQFKRQSDAQMDAARSQFRFDGIFGAPHETIVTTRTVQKVPATPSNLCPECGACLTVCGVAGLSGDTEVSCGACGFEDRIPARILKVRM